ncbi:AfsR/SARP family transcriptional regulator [Actinomadura madurae]|uniref:AfsR/SARP family transcriptional regulator n=1 Tax=Actinomadura madurae TaxID=1993 RepID=UPI0020D1FCC6|nr:AfsR/SARP family transcriptional regulator [Actinomadura madurae]MCP9955759.1 winged helix-turn-helix domain-containing protein [Actinomadura madurae]MCP9972501.1 winged helix-turn-helix domain-containing protein [Actinomadura madurae]MCP9984996.1 winged helix-turn-helix domain-containing protein [Actinomadura madurae]
MTGLTFGLLGDLEIRDGEREMRINTGKLRVMLASLLLGSGNTVSFDELALRLWDDEPPSTMRGTVQAYAMRLRQALGDSGRDPRLILTRHQGYAIDVRAEQVDVLRFRSLLGAARTAGQNGDMPGEAARLDEALRLWRGTALAGIPSESLRRDVLPFLVEERLQAWERRIEIDFELGRHAELIGELTSLTREYPLRESFWSLLMASLYRSGRQAEALDTFATVRRLLRDELGIDPGARLHELHRQILAGEEALPAAPAAEPANLTAPARPEAPPARTAQLPSATRGFAGRTEALARVCRWIDPAGADAAVQVVIVSGGPGVGKTALALQAAHKIRSRFPDGQLYAELGGHSGSAPVAPAAVLARFLRDLGVPADQVPEPQDDLEAMYRSVLADREVLVVLDGAASADQVRPLLPGGYGSAVLATSRHNLSGLSVVHGGRRLALSELSPAESRSALAGIIGRSRAQAEPKALDELAEVCAHLPLALRIAGIKLAAHPRMPVAEYVRCLRDAGPFEALHLDDDPGIGVEAAFHASYAQLPPETRRFFVRLARSLESAFTIDAAVAHLNCDPASARSNLDRLTGANLLVGLVGGGYRFNELVRAYGAALADDEPHGRSLLPGTVVDRLAG